MRKILLLIFSMLTTTLFSQNKNVTGNVTEKSSGDPIPGVTVIVKGSNVGTETDFNGSFQLNNVNPSSILVFSFVGMETKEIKVGLKNALNVVLEQDNQLLNEVVVVGYGTQRKKELTGAVSVVSNEAIEELKPVRVEQALQGQVAGVNITTSSGAPGAASNIRIRGISTNGDNRPLILVDGNRIEDLSVINPSDIQSINILKDATAGIYGVQAANGVILITTKSGRKNSDFKFTFNSYTGLQETTRTIPLLNATEYALLINEAHAANGETLPFSSVNGLGQGTNWQEEVFNTAFINSSDITINKGYENVALSFGASYLDQDGIVGVSKSNFNRFTSKLNITADIIDKLKLTSTVIYTKTNRSGLAENVLGSVLFNALNFDPTLPVTDTNGNYTLTPVIGFGSEVINPLAQINDSFNRTTVHKIAPTIRLNYEVLPGLKAEGRFQYNYATVNTRSFAPEANYGESSTVFDRAINSYVDYKVGYQDFIFDAFLTYEKTINDVHKFNALVGTSVSKAQVENINNKVFEGMPIADFDNPNTESATRVVNVNEEGNIPRNVDGDRLLSYFTRLQYNYEDKYLLSFMIRRDGSSKFGPKNKFGYFPSASVGWVVSEENFLKNDDLVNFLKIRASYGIVGNDRIPAFAYESLLDGEGAYVFDEVVNIGLTPGRLSNPEIRWEKQKPLNIGFDLKVFNKVDFTFDFFRKETEDLLLSPQVSGTLGVGGPGAAAPIVNAGTVVNQGFEFSLAYKNNVSEDFSYAASFNLTSLKNEVLRVNGEGDFLFGGNFGVGGENDISRMQKGFPIGYFHGYKTDGIFQNQTEVNNHANQDNANPGDIRYVDINKDGVINEDDRTYVGDPIPDVTFGVNLSFNYKNFDMSMYGFASIGNDIVRNFDRNLPRTNKPTYYLDRWRGEGTSNTFPRVTTGANNNYLFSDFYVEDGSFFRLQNAQVGYTLDQRLVDQFKLDKLRFYVSVNNLFTLTKYNGYDPNVSNGNPIGDGIDLGFYPTPRTYLFGVNVKF
ncbi:SusC/RagA family TonB-linked outer membrane protein [Tenacibaculum geojense]|uniref:SusC/RagA family TonB-linked outer membrane protein n=1 Tax=Tenacibaculum geojense TaxID=915352 RepID=A0ABW3JRD1_9FLAO